MVGRKLRGKLIQLKEDARLVPRGQTQWEGDPLKKGKAQWTGPKPKPPPSWEKGRAVFNEPETAPRNRARPDYYHEPPLLTPDLEACMVPGGCVIAKFDLEVGYNKGVYPFFPLERYYGQPGGPVTVRAGSLLMYAGAVRCTESKFHAEHQKYVNVQVFKHTFITPSGRCIIHDFSLIGPA